MRVTRALTALACAAAILSPLRARAAPAPADTALAETLFRQGKELLAKQDFEAACPKLAESYRIDPGAGVLLALALCHEGQGRLASAWIELNDVITASASTRPDRAAFAREHAAAIEPQLSTLTIDVAPALAELADVELLRDGVRLERPAWGATSPIDGGDHLLEARAPGRKTWRLRVSMAPSRDRRILHVPALDPESAAIGEAPAPSDARRMWGYGLSGLGIAAIGAGAYFGIAAVVKIHDAKSQCPSPPGCTNASALDTNSEGLRDATIADVAIGAGLVAGIIGTYLVLSSPTSRASQRVRATDAARVLPTLARGKISLAWVQPF